MKVCPICNNLVPDIGGHACVSNFERNLNAQREAMSSHYETLQEIEFKKTLGNLQSQIDLLCRQVEMIAKHMQPINDSFFNQWKHLVGKK